MNKTVRLKCQNRTDWLAQRINGIGGSEAAAACGMSPWMSPLELWKLKTGRSEAKDLSGNAAVEQGNRMEPALRTMFAALHPEYEVEYHQFDILCQEDRPWLFATLDGELKDANGAQGILEIKTATPGSKAGWDNWSDGKMPENYYIQTLHQLLATGYAFVILFAALYSMVGDITLRQYEIYREDVSSDLSWLLDKETVFWTKNVCGGEMPPVPIKF